jgi:TRAP-type C4-dicarboxylate transport system permease small subunit
MQRAATTAATLLEGVAAVFLAGTMLLTVADVALRSISNEWRIYGVVEVVVLMFAWSVFLALPPVFLLRQNIVVNVLDSIVKQRVSWFIAFAGIITVIYLGFLGSQAVTTASEALRFSDQTMYLEIPIFAYMLPIIIGIGGAFLAEIYLLFRPEGPTPGIRTSDS